MSDSYVNQRRFEAATAELTYWQERAESARAKDDGAVSRDELAARAMTALLGLCVGEIEFKWADLATGSYALADAMLAARESK